MIVSYNWLREFVEFDASPEEIARIVTFQCFELEDLTPVRRNVEGVIAGRIVESVPHPDADRLQVAKVDTGGEILSIVCGAPNCHAGIIAPVAKVGARLSEIVVEGRKIRGVKSSGMILAEDEMGISDNHDGIIELPENIQPGTELSSLVEAEDTIFDFEVTVNRPDAMSHLGIAREIAAHFRLPLSLPPMDLEEIGQATGDRVKVEILAPQQGPRYVARMVSGVKVAPSPLWMKARLWSLGQRSINNVVDITNYVLHELGHPLHAFDYRLLNDGKIIVRMAEEGEKFVTLDQQERALKSTDLLIADPGSGVALAGVMGGANSEVNEETAEVLIEAAYFDPVTIRQTSKRLGLSSEASRRFERGADPSMPPIAAKRCARLLCDMAGGKALHGEVDAYPVQIRSRKVNLRPSRVNHILGMEVPGKSTIEALRSLQLEVKESGRDDLEVTVPTFRPDLEREIDLIEEVARIVGYEKVPDAESSRITLSTQASPMEDLVDAVTDTMAELGFHEAITSSLVAETDQAEFSSVIRPHILTNPLNPEMNSYRASLLPGLLRAVQRNLNHGTSDVRLFEAGQVGGKGWGFEEDRLRVNAGFAVTGKTRPIAFDRNRNNYDLFDLKGDIYSLLTGLSLDKTMRISYDTPENLEHGFLFSLESGKIVLIAGQLKTGVAASFGIEKPVYVCEADIESWVDLDGETIKRPGSGADYRPFSRFPASERDLAFFIPPAITAGEVESAIRSAGGELLEELTLFDVYQGKPLKANERSLAYHLVFRATDRTLEDNQVTSLIKQIVGEVQKLPGVSLRS